MTKTLSLTQKQIDKFLSGVPMRIETKGIDEIIIRKKEKKPSSIDNKRVKKIFDEWR